MKLTVLIVALAFVVLVAAVQNHGLKHMKPKKVHAITQALVDEINNMNTTWTADLNKGSSVDGKSIEEARRFCGVLPGGPKLPAKKFAPDTDFAGLPTQFSSITNWPNCPTISTIRDQSACGSCWAFGAVESMSDRSCIGLGKQLSLSAGNMAFCCGSCGNGCDGGYPPAAWQYWVDHGVTEEGCYPYPFPGCDHHIPSSANPCPANEYPSPPCPNKCTNKSWTGAAWKQDRHYGSSAYSLDSVSKIQADIYKHGPVEAAFEVYADFLTYKSGVYQHKSGSLLGGHAIKILGWGVMNGTPYWLCANSWNPDWGNNGFFNILRGSDECGIEDGVVAGLAKN
jgi:cathepsin B